ncbi:hypothetical protein GCK72_021350 [Caenorhabditis remanei]|uniref:F-box domain-containing protein n=1 Tax=Caenorhabditis remanei TaxID=31234 RepID=A0A6A5GJJ4_CAERE|nr:hypothetical protein GCK72_021350 [Caenorhabditis remanei]KAF1754786.1 hypothetical protein GCK72_021350 [Caenorhabditis remanei]
MPDDVMDRILGNVGMEEVFSLRKVCRRLRKQLDRVVPDIRLTQLHLSICQEQVELGYDSDRVTYLKLGPNCMIWQDTAQENGTSMRKKKSRKILVDEDYFHMFLEDLQLILKHQKATLDVLNVVVSEELTDKVAPILGRILKQNPHPLAVNTLLLDIDTEADVLQMLPHVNEDVIKVLELTNPRTDIQEFPLYTGELRKLAVWKKLEELRTRNIAVMGKPYLLGHFQRANVVVDQIRDDDVRYLKNVLIKSPYFQYFHLKYLQFDGADQLFSNLFFTGVPPSFETINDVPHYLYRMPDTTQFLSITHHMEEMTISFGKIDASVIQKIRESRNKL